MPGLLFRLMGPPVIPTGPLWDDASRRWCARGISVSSYASPSSLDSHSHTSDGVVERLASGVYGWMGGDELGYHQQPAWINHWSQPSSPKRSPLSAIPAVSGTNKGIGQPVDCFCLSPVCEALGCLWQWRPTQLTHPSTVRATSTQLFMLPFLLLPVGGVVQAQMPYIHPDAVRRCLATTHGTAPTASVDVSQWQAMLPSPLGTLTPSIGDHCPPRWVQIPPQKDPAARDTRVASGAPEGAARTRLLQSRHQWVGEVVQLLCHAVPGSISSPLMKFSPDGTHEVSPLESRCNAEGSVGLRASSTPSPLTSVSAPPAKSPVPSSLTATRGCPPAYQNVLTGGLAEVVLAADRYAALIARGEMTVAAACWAVLCDQRYGGVLRHLRFEAIAVEQEVLAATAAHRIWQRQALKSNKTLVGSGAAPSLIIHEHT